MAVNFFKGGIRVVQLFSMLCAALMLTMGCGETTSDTSDLSNSDENKDNIIIPPSTLPENIDTGVIPPVVQQAPQFDLVNLMVKTDPADPHNERFLDDWRFQIYSIDDQARATSPIYYGETGPDGVGAATLPVHILAQPMVVNAYNDAYPLGDPDDDGEKECRSFEIFIPAFCYDKAIWLLGPLEDAVWDFYKEAAMRRGEAWNPSQVDCATWLANLQFLILTDEVDDELEAISGTDTMLFEPDALYEALRENQHLLVPTRPPICMAERRHNGGGLERAEILEDEVEEDETIFVTLDDFDEEDGTTDEDPIIIGDNGIVSDICGCEFDGELVVNTAVFDPEEGDSYYLDDEDFIGAIFDQEDIVLNMDVSVYNVRLGNGRELDHDKYDDVCSLTTLVGWTNKDDDEQDVLTNTGVTFTDLFGDEDTEVYLTSDGDGVVDPNDYWAIFYGADGVMMEEKVIVVEFLGHRQEDFRDVLHIDYDIDSEDLQLELRADYELNEEEVDGERAFMGFTITTWDGTSEAGRWAIRENIANCYEAADVWARQYFVTKDFQVRADAWCPQDECEIESTIKPLVAAEFQVRSQCFSNSRANSRWQTDDVGFWSMNTTHGVHPNVVINPGWLAPDLDFELYIQHFDEAVFKGPRTIRRTDDCGQLMAAIPTLVEGDRILIKSEDNCCDDYDLVLPCVPEFTGFAGGPGIPYVPQQLGPPPVDPLSEEAGVPVP